MSVADHETTRRLLAALDEAADRIEVLEQERHEPIAIIGLSCRFPGGADDPASFWRLLRDGTDAISEVPADRWDLAAYYDPDPDAAGKMYARHGGFISGVDLFDPQFFEIAPREAVTLDPQQRLLLELTWQAFEDANLPRERLAGTPAGVFVGITNSDYERVLSRIGGEARVDAYFSSGNTLNAAAGRLAYSFGLQGPAMAIDTACSSSLVAVHLACQSLRRGECPLAVAAGVNLILSPEGHIALSRARMVAPDGRCKTFDAAADGYVRGEGGGVVILRRLSDAVAAGDVPLAVIRGSAVNQDGASGGFTVPSGPAQQALLRRALADARLSPADIGYVEAHGTGTSLGDPIEAGALAAVFGAEKSKDQPLLIGSLKTNVGHLESAAGIAGLIKIVLALRHGEIPPHLHFHNPTPHVPWQDVPLRVVTAATAWPSTPRRAGLSSFGASGTNAHVIVEEAPPAPAPQPGARSIHAIVLSARTEQALAEHARNLCEFLESTDADLADVAYAASAGRSHFPYRLATVAGSVGEAAASLRAFLAGDQHRVQHGHSREADASQQECDEILEFDRCSSDWRSQLERVAALYVRGVAIDWARLDKRDRRGHVRLPPYPFQRRRYWIETADRGSMSLVGRRLSLPRNTEVRFESVIRADTHEFLQDHRVQGQVVFPAAAYVEMALEAAAEALGRAAVALEDVVFERPLVLPHGTDVTLHLVVGSDPATDRLNPSSRPVPESDPGTPRHRGLSSTFSIYSRQGGDWALHATGRILTAPPADPGAVPQDAARTEEFSGHAYYEECARRGIEFGPAFRGLEALWRLGGDQSEGLIRLPDALPARAYAIHPVLLDGAFQTLGPATAGRDPDAAFLPFSIGRLRFYRRPAATLSARARLAPESPEPGAHGRELSASVVLWDATGVVAEVEDFTLRRAGARVAPAPDPLYLVTWKETPRGGLPAKGRALRESCVILPDRGGVGVELSRLLATCGVASTLVEPGDSAGLFREAAAAPLPLRHVVQLQALDVPDLAAAGAEALDRELRRVCEGTLDVIRRAAGMTSPPRLWLVTRGAQPADETVSAAGCAQAALWGLVRTAAMEHDDLRPVRIDLENAGGAASAARDAAHLCDEMIGDAPDDEVAVRGARRLVPRLARLRATDQTIVRTDGAHRRAGVRSDRTYLITGGLGGLGLVTAEWLIGKGARHLVLVGRGGPDDTVSRRVHSWRDSGVAVLTHACDVSVGDQLADALARARSLAPLGGIFHSAGTLADGTLAYQDWDKFRRVFAAKVHGAWNLHHLTLDDPLELFVLYASTAGVLGSPGQGNHAAANAFVDALAWYRRSTGRPALAIDWGAWSGVGVAARHQVGDKARAKGVGLIDPQMGGRVLERLLPLALTQVAVAPIDWAAFARQFPAGSVPGLIVDLAGGSVRSAASGRESAGDVCARITAAPPERQHGILVEYILECVSHVLDIPVDQLDGGQPLNTLGLDSLMALELRNRFKFELGLDVPVTTLLVGSNAGAVASRIRVDLEQRAPAAQAPAAAAPAQGAPSHAEMLARVDELSDEQIDELLAALQKDGELS